jgi:5-methylthioadenosine/S-adenosylhomocysteine deaminase
MEKVDVILKHALVLTMDPSLTRIDDGAVVIQGNSIRAIDETKEIEKKFSASKEFNINRNILMPGLINAHTHIPMTLLRGLADDLRLDVWLMGYMMPVEREFVSPDFVRLGSLLACAEMIRSGVTCFADMYYFEEEIAKSVYSVGMRAICAQSVLKFPTPDAKSYEIALDSARDFIRRWKKNDLIIPAIAPHAPYTCPPEILKACTSLAMEYDIPLHTHLSETAYEVENMRNEHGMPVIPYVKKLGLFEAKVIAAHCVHIDEGEMRTLLHAGVGVAHNPTSNMKLASGAAPIKKMLEVGLNVGIGTDGPASNNDLDMFEEIRLASFLSKVTTGDPTALPAQQVLQMATRIGAHALHIAEITGSIEVGKKADLIIINRNLLHSSPHFSRDPNNIYAEIVYSTKSTDVTDVMVNGKWLMQNRRLSTINEEEILKQSQEYAKKIDQFLIHREKSVLSKLIAIGGATEEESYEVQAKVVIDDTQKVLGVLNQSSSIEIIRTRHYREYDTYFSFAEKDQGFIRYREDHFIESDGSTSTVRSRLTHIGKAVEQRFPQDVILSRSRFLAPATQSLRFYREYFKPDKITEIEKERFRFLVKYQHTEFFINIDVVDKPDAGQFLEIKSRTWSQRDAEKKSKLLVKLIKALGEDPTRMVSKDYFEIAENFQK